MNSSQAYHWAKAELVAVHEKALIMNAKQPNDDDVGQGKKGPCANNVIPG